MVCELANDVVDELAEGELEIIEELLAKCKKLLVLDDDEPLPLAGAPVNEGLGMPIAP